MKKVLLFLATAALCGAQPALAVGYNFVRNSAIGGFSEADLTLHRNAIDQALISTAFGKPVEWSNDKTGSSGSVTPQAGDTPECRRLSVVTQHRRIKDQGERYVCKVKGQWRIVS